MRKKLLINPQLQFKLINYVVAFYSLISIIFYGVNCFLLNKMYSFGKEAKLSANSSYFSFINTLEIYSIICYGLVFILGLVVVYVVGIYISLRIAGPIYRIDRTLSEIVDNLGTENAKNLKEVNIKLRGNDFFEDHAKLVSEVIKKIS